MKIFPKSSMLSHFYQQAAYNPPRGRYPCLSLATMASQKQEANYNSSSEDSDDDENFDIFDAVKKRSKNSGSTKRAAKIASMITTADPTTKIKALLLSEQEKEAALAKIENVDDRRLQVLLWELGCYYVVLKHQFRGVRELANVSESFPDSGIEDLNVTAEVVKQILQSAEPCPRNNRGLLMADVMGLGKTVQAVLACILRNAISRAKGEAAKPTLIVNPNESVLEQWRDTLVQAGVDEYTIWRFETKNAKNSKPLRGEIFILCTRYDLQTEARYCFESIRSGMFVKLAEKSQLFPNVPIELPTALKNQYRAAKGREKNKYNEKDGTRISIEECVTHLLAQQGASVSKIFRTVIIDEAHFLKSLRTYWGMAAGMIGLHAEMMIPMTGTPFNNTLQDMATLMTFIQPSHRSAYKRWWVKATNNGAAKSVQKAVESWSSKYMVRRGKDAIEHLLPKKTVRKESVQAYPFELVCYEEYERSFLKVLKQLRKIEGENSPNLVAQRRFQQMMQMMLMVASCMRSALIHPVIPGGGRDLTVFFSPSRASRKSVLKRQEKKNQCVCCRRQVKLSTRKKRTSDEAGEDFLDENDSDDGDHLFCNEEVEDLLAKENTKGNPKGKGEILPIPQAICSIGKNGLRHFACATCLQSLQLSNESCPQCSRLLSCCDGGVGELQSQISGSSNVPADLDDGAKLQLSQHIYCRDVFGGFRSTTKLETILSDFEHKLPPKDKVLIVSFFKSSLDLLEAMFEERYQIPVLRFDGDIKKEERKAVLETFKCDDSYRVLLMTVQTGGVGLNLVSANHVWFVDRSWNPTVMEQCEDRCHRLQQKKDVSVVYYDISLTIDDAMAHINKVKSTNAAVILSDGPALAQEMSFQEITGFLGRAIECLRETRIKHVKADPKNNFLTKLPAANEDILEYTPPITRRSDEIPSMKEVFMQQRQVEREVIDLCDSEDKDED